MTIKEVKIKPKDRVHYVNNADFSSAVVAYVTEKNTAIAAGDSAPVVTAYIAECFLKICEGLSHRPNFVRYTYREEMVMDGVENCLRAIGNYKIDTKTRTGKPNAFSYFTQIAFFAFLRRLAKEKKEQDIKTRYIESMSADDFILVGDTHNTTAAMAASAYLDEIRNRNGVMSDPVDAVDPKKEIEKFAKEEEIELTTELKGLEVFLSK